MIDQSIRAFLGNLEQQDEMIRFVKEVDPLINMSALGWKARNELGKSSLFTNIKGHEDWRACSHVLSDRRKWAIGLGVDEGEILETIARRTRSRIDTVDLDGSDAPVKEIALTDDAVNLDDIPAMITSERDGGRYLASGMAIIKDPDTGIRNMSIHRQQILNGNKTGFMMVPRHARRIYEKYCARGEPMPVAMVYGVHPAIYYGAVFAADYGRDELAVAGALLGEGVRMVKCETIDIEVPAEAEMVIEGEVLPNHTEPEGPFGEVTGMYAARGHAEVFGVKAITHRKDPVFYALHCGFPVSDNGAMTALGIEVATREHLQNVEGGLDLLDVRCPDVAGIMMLVIKLRPRVEGQAKTALMAALSGPYFPPKMAVAVDDDIDASDFRQIVWSMTTRVHAERDIVLIPNTRIFLLDNVSPLAPGQSSRHRIGTKWLIDATRPAVTQVEECARFERAMPMNFEAVKLDDFLP